MEADEQSVYKEDLSGQEKEREKAPLPGKKGVAKRRQEGDQKVAER